MGELEYTDATGVPPAALLRDCFTQDRPRGSESALDSPGCGETSWAAGAQVKNRDRVSSTI